MSVVFKKLGIFGATTTTLGGGAYLISEFASDSTSLTDDENKASLKEKAKEVGVVLRNKKEEATETHKVVVVTEEAPKEEVKAAPAPEVTEAREEVKTQPVKPVEKQTKKVTPPAKPRVTRTVQTRTTRHTSARTVTYSRSTSAKVVTTSKSISTPGLKKATKHPWRAWYYDVEFNGKDWSKNSYGGRWGEKYARYLVATGDTDTKGQTQNNKPWWNSKFEELRNDETLTTGKFSTLKVLDDKEAGGEMLRSICDAVYRLDAGLVNETGEGDGTYKEADVWKYCSYYGEKVYTLSDDTMSDLHNSYIDINENKKVLVDGLKERNIWFWELKVEELKEATGLHKNSEFRRIKEQGILTVDQLRYQCRNAHSQDVTGTWYPKAEVFQFCSLTGVAFSSNRK